MTSLVLQTYDTLSHKLEKSSVFYAVKRSILPLIIGTFVVSGLLFSSTVAYFIFYWSYIPSVGIARDVHLQFRSAAPWGSVDLADSGMLSGQPYAAFVELDLPRTQNNLEIGNFMVSLSLMNQANATLATSSRPAILTYTSPLITTSLTVLNSPLLITGFKKESETLLVPVMERFEFPASRAARPRYANIEIDPYGGRIQVYSTKLIFVAQFEGIRTDDSWFMYSHRIIAFALFNSLFFISSSLFAGLTWFIFSLRSNPPPPSDLGDRPSSSPSEHPPTPAKLQLKHGPHDDDDDDDTVTVSPTSTPRPGLSSYSSTSTSRSFPPVSELSTHEEIRQGLKRGLRDLREIRPEESMSGIMRIKTDDESVLSAESLDVDDNVERAPVSEVSF